MIISPIRVAKSEMVLRILGLALVSYNGSNHVCFVSRISVSFAAKKKKVGRYSSVRLWRSHFFSLPLLALL